MNQVNANKVGLVLGGVMAIVHAVWAIMVLVKVAKPFMDWVLGLHFLNFQYSMDSFSYLNALLLLVVTFVVGYIVGVVFAWLWNLAHRTAHGQ